MDNSKNRPNDYLGVNKIGKQIRKSPLHQPNYVNSSGSGNNNINNSARQQPQPHVYNISKSDFRSIVQQLTGSPSRQDPLPRPPNNPPKPPSMRLQRIRPPPLTPINRPPIPPMVAAPPPMQPPPQGQHMGRPPMVPYNNSNYYGMPPPSQFGQPSPRGMHPMGHGEAGWANPALSPISAYMQQLQNCIGDGGPNFGQPTGQPPIRGTVPSQPSMMQPQVQGQSQPQPHPHPHPHPYSQVQPQHPGQGQGLLPLQPQHPGQVQGQGQPTSAGLLPNPNTPPLRSPRMNGPAPALLPSPSSDFLLPSPSSFFNLLSPQPRSPFPLLSPGSQFPTPLSPNFAFSPMGQSGILGPSPQPPLSPGLFPLSPSGFFPISSPRWRD